MRLAALLLILAVAVATLACASAMPPPQGGPPVIATDAGGADADAAAARAQEGERLWQLRPDAAAVAASRDAYLAAAGLAPDDAAPVAGAVRALVWLTDHEADEAVRDELATTAVRVALECATRDAAAPTCPYWLALAIGVQADARRATAIDGVKRMVPLLRQAIDGDALQDHAGPHRVLARVLARAPGWPTGPGDADEAVTQAQRAVELDAEYAANWLALGEAQAQAGNDDGSRRAYERARELALRALQQGHPDAAEWLREAEAAQPRR